MPPTSFVQTHIFKTKIIVTQAPLYHILKEVNSCVDILAKADCVQQVDFISYVTSPPHVFEALKFDIFRFCLYSICWLLMLFIFTQKKNTINNEEELFWILQFLNPDPPLFAVNKDTQQPTLDRQQAQHPNNLKYSSTTW